MHRRTPQVSEDRSVKITVELLVIKVKWLSVIISHTFSRFDQTLLAAEKQGLTGDDWRVFYNEMQAHIFFHAGTLLLKKAQQVIYHGLSYMGIFFNVHLSMLHIHH